MKKKVLGLVLLFLITVTIFGCKKAAVISDEPFIGDDVLRVEVDENADANNNFILTKDAFILTDHNEEIKSDDGNTIYMTINYQTIKVMSGIGASDSLIHATDVFSRGIEERVKEFKGNLDAAKEQFETREGFPATYEFNGKIDILTAVTLDRASILSICSNEYEFTAGAHGSTIMHYMNFDDRSGKSITLDDICNGNSADGNLENAILEALSYMEEDLFPEYKEMVHDYFVKDEYILDFYIENKGDGYPMLIISFPQYAIAPYATGIIGLNIQPDKNYMDMKYFK